MSALTITWGQVLFIALIILAVYAAEMAFFYWRLRQHHFSEHLALVRLRELEKNLEALQRRVHAESTASLMLRDMPQPAVQTPVNPPSSAPELIVATPKKISPPEPDSAASYNQAIDLAKEGANAQQLSRECGLSRGEADLIVSLYGLPGERR